MSPMLSRNLSPRNIAAFVAVTFLAAALFGPFAHASPSLGTFDGEAHDPPESERPEATIAMEFRPSHTYAYDGRPAESTLLVSNPWNMNLEVKIAIGAITHGWRTDFREGLYQLAPRSTAQYPVKLAPSADVGDQVRGELVLHARTQGGYETKAALVAKTARSNTEPNRISMELAPDVQRAHAGEKVVYKLVVKNHGRSSVALGFEAYSPEHKIRVWMDETSARIGANETRRFAVHATSPEDLGAGEHTIVVHARHHEVTTQAEPAPSDVPATARARLVIVGDEVCCEKPIRGHATGNGYRIFVPLEEGRSFDLPIRVSGHVRDGMLVLDIAVEGQYDQGRPEPRPTQEPQPAQASPTHGPTPAEAVVVE